VLIDATVEGRTLRVEVRPRASGYDVVYDGRNVPVDAVFEGDHFASLIVEGRSHDVALEPTEDGFRVHLRGGPVDVAVQEARGGVRPPAHRASGPFRLVSPMPGRVVRVLAPAGSDVAAGAGVVVVEAMKMENELRAPRAGRVAEVAVQEGQAVEAGALLAVID
jgi:biotin carboxyl carrier protein